MERKTREKRKKKKKRNDLENKTLKENERAAVKGLALCDRG